MMYLNTNQKEECEGIAIKYGITLLVLFGSYATGRQHAKSDIDIAYRSTQSIPLEQEAHLILDLSRILKNEHIDLVNIRVAPPLLRYAIFREGILLYEKEPYAFASFAIFAFKQYVEAKPLFAEQVRRFKETL